MIVVGEGKSARVRTGEVGRAREDGWMLVVGRGGNLGVKSCGETDGGEPSGFGGTLATLVVLEP